MQFLRFVTRRMEQHIIAVCIVAAATAALARDSMMLEGTEQLTPVALLGLLAIAGAKFVAQLLREYAQWKSPRSTSGADLLDRLDVHMIRGEQANRDVIGLVRDTMRTVTEFMREEAGSAREIALRLDALERRVRESGQEVQDAIGSIYRRMDAAERHLTAAIDGSPTGGG